MQSSRGEMFFHFAFGECNSTRVTSVAINMVEDTVTLVYRPPSFGSLMVGSERNGGAGSSAVVVCICTAPMTAVVGSGPLETVPEQQAEGQSNIVGDTEFKVSFGMYTDNSFKTALPIGSVLPDSSPRLYFKVTSLSLTDNIGLVNCTASPTSSINDPYAARFVSASCSVGPLDYLAHSEIETNAIHSSLLNFKFAGSTDVFIWCSVIRCLSEPCGHCTRSQSRRLGVAMQVARRLQGQGGTLAQGWFQTEFSTAAVILPGPLLSRSTALVMWKPFAAPRLTGSDVRSNLTLFGFAANASTSFEHLAGAVSAALSKFFVRNVQVLRILAAVLPIARMLSEGPQASRHLRTEALIVENSIQVHEGDKALVLSKLASFSRGSEVTTKFASSLRMEMESLGLNAPARLQVDVSIPPAAGPTPTAAPMRRQESESTAGLSLKSSIIIICVACLINSSVCALLACIWWQNKRRRTLCAKSTNTRHTHTPPVKVVDTTQDARGLYLPSAKSLDATQEISGTEEVNEGICFVSI